MGRMKSKEVMRCISFMCLLNVCQGQSSSSQSSCASCQGQPCTTSVSANGPVATCSSAVRASIDETLFSQDKSAWDFTTKPAYWQWRFAEHISYYRNNDWGGIARRALSYSSTEILRFLRTFDVAPYQAARADMRLGKLLGPQDAQLE